ncbi:NPCBM/NEW2 domain-containing protein [Rugosimonospora acidiphila]|uniref:Alpha-galactosidase n=1 Tax=Rugosimonospora acidiphila TaxID=556531 RepID=A0ABP9SV51_9ACTN
MAGITVDSVRPAPALALDNGLARTPPMGFNDWNAFGCNVSEQLIKQTADFFVSSGLKAAGYQYVNIDDCWMTHTRDPQTGRLVPDPVKFPDGISGTADYVHSLGLKLGIYEDAGTATCAGYPGSLGHETVDAQTFADWGVDYLKYDNCNNAGSTTQQQYITRYTTMRDALAATGRPIVYSLCEWGVNQPWTWGADVGNLWRTTGDISDNWNSLKSIIEQNLPLYPDAKPGAFNDPDMLEVGNGGMTDTEYRTHFAIWSMLSAPLLIGTDLRKASAATMAILTNKNLIAVDQDPLAKQAVPISDSDGHVVLAKPLSNGDMAVALYNENDVAARIGTTAAAAGLTKAPAYTELDLWQNTTTETAGTISAVVPAHGTVVYRIAKAGATWSASPPATDLGIDLPDAAQTASQLLVKPDQPIAVTTNLTDHGRAPATEPAVTLTAPAGWGIAIKSSPTGAVLATDRPLTTQWTVTPPAGTPPGSYQFTATAVYGWKAGTWLTTSSTVSFLIATPPAAGTHYLSDLTWLSANNDWGPVEKDTSNGEQPAGDGTTITINGATYAKGLGTNAPSEIDYYLAGACDSVTTDVGIDDEKDGSDADASFQIYADGKKVADSGPMTAADPAVHLAADVTGAQLLRLVVDDDGSPDSDHGDWAGAQLTCQS